MNVTSQGIGPSTGTWSKMGLGWTLYYGRDSPGFNHFPRGLHLHSSIGTGISDGSSEEIYKCTPYKCTHQYMGEQLERRGDFACWVQDDEHDPDLKLSMEESTGFFIATGTVQT